MCGGLRASGAVPPYGPNRLTSNYLRSYLIGLGGAFLSGRQQMIRPWVFEFFPELKHGGGSAAEPAASDYFGRYLDLWQRDEELGFEGIFFSEHHFGGSFSASPNLFIASVAPRTRKLRLGGVGGAVPYYHPPRLVEGMGILVYLTGGRLALWTPG